MRKILYALGVLIALNGCTSFHYGSLAGGAYPPSPDYQIIGTRIATSSTFHVLGFGGNKKEALIFDAKQQLYANYPLSKGQHFVNFTMDYKKTFYPFCSRLQLTLAADIVAEDPQELTLRPDSTLIYFFNIHQPAPFEIRENLQFKNPVYSVVYEGRIFQQEGSNILVKFKDNSGDLNYKKFDSAHQKNFIRPHGNEKVGIEPGSLIHVPLKRVQVDGREQTTLEVVAGNDNYYILQLTEGPQKDLLIVMRKKHIDQITK